MPKFAFKLAALLGYRRHQRDLCRQLLAEAFAEDQALQDQRRNFEELRETQIDEIRGLTATAVVNVDKSASRRYYAGQLTVEIRLVEIRRAEVAQKVAACRNALIQADQKVRALEKLSEKQLIEHVSDEERRTARQLEESWMAAHLQELLNQ